MSEIKLNTVDVAPYILKEIDAGTYELPEKTLAAKYFNSNDRVLELGSAIGYVGIATMQTHPGISWLGIEANPWCVQRAEENYRLNNLQPSIINGVATLEESKEPIKFYVREEFWNSSLDSTELEYSKIVDVVDSKAIAINNLLGKERNALLIDIEGGETSLIKFENGLNIDRVQKLIIEFHSRFTGKDYVEYAIDAIERTHMLVEKMGEVYYFRRKEWIRS